MINEREILTKLFVSLCEAQKNFSEAHNQNITQNPNQPLGNEAIGIINELSILLDKYDSLLHEKYNVDTYELFLNL